MHFREYMKFTEVSAVFAFSTYLLSPILSPYIRGLGFSDFQLGLIFSFLPLSIVIFSPIIGKLSDVTDRRFVILTGITLEIVAIILYLFGRSIFLISLARILDAVAVVTVILISLAKVEDVIDSKRGEYTGWTETMNYIGKLTAPLVGGLVADYFFIQAPFLISLTLLLVLFLFLFRKERLPKIAKGGFNPVKEIKEFLSHKKLRGMAILGMVMHATTPAMSIFLPLFIIEKLGMSISFVGYAFFSLGFMHLLQFWFGKLSDRYGSWRIILLGCLVSAIGMTFLSLSNTFLLLIIFLLIRGMGNGLWNVSAWTLMSDIGEKHEMEGEVVTSYISLAKIGSFVSFILSGLVVTYFSIQALFLINGVVVLFGTVLAYKFLKE